jgi:hypothetical protein
LGGYDDARRGHNGIEFEMSPNNMTRFEVGVHSISLGFDIQSQAPTPPLSDVSNAPFRPIEVAIIDSTQPYIQLPPPECDRIQQSLNLTWDPQNQHYLIDNSTYRILRKLKPSLSFNIIQHTTGSNRALLVRLPYESLLLNLSYPYVDDDKTVRYFPLRPTNNTRNMWILGRAFLQNAYITADYERKKFYVHQVKWPENNETSIIKPIFSAKTNSHAIQLSSPATAGLVLSIVSVIGLTILGLLFYRRRRRKTAQIFRGRAKTGQFSSSSPAEGQKQEVDSEEILEAGNEERILPREMEAKHNISELAGNDDHVGVNDQQVELDAGSRANALEADDSTMVNNATALRMSGHIKPNPPSAERTGRLGAASPIPKTPVEYYGIKADSRNR